MNLVAAYCRFFPPQIARSRYTGNSSSSQARKKSSMSCTANTAIWPPSIANNKKKKSFGLKVTGHAARAARAVMKLVSRISGIEMPSAPTDQARPRSGSQV